MSLIEPITPPPGMKPAGMRAVNFFMRRFPDLWLPSETRRGGFFVKPESRVRLMNALRRKRLFVATRSTDFGQIKPEYGRLSYSVIIPRRISFSEIRSQLPVVTIGFNRMYLVEQCRLGYVGIWAVEGDSVCIGMQVR